MRAERIFEVAESIVKRYGTRDPFELLEALHVSVRYSERYGKDGLKGYCKEILQTKYVVINNLIELPEMIVTAAHEAGHIILQPDVMRIRTFHDANILDSTDQLEYDANMFAANFLVSDKMMLDALNDNDGDAYAAARELCVPPQFLAFKLFSMTQRGKLKGNMPLGLDSRFLGKSLS